MTEEEIQIEIDVYNSAAKYGAQCAYTEKSGEELASECKRLTVCVAERYLALMDGEAPRAFGSFDRDAIARIFNANTLLSFGGLDPDPTKDPTHASDWTECTCPATFEEPADEAYIRYTFCEAYMKYLHSAASAAKSADAPHTMRLYLRAWGILRRAIDKEGPSFWLDGDDAIKVVDLEKTATDRLYIDIEAASLPDFKQLQAEARKERS